MSNPGTVVCFPPKKVGKKVTSSYLTNDSWLMGGDKPGIMIHTLCESSTFPQFSLAVPPIEGIK